MKKSVKVFIVDDHDMVRLGIKTYLSIEENIEVVGEAIHGKSAIEQLTQGLSAGFPDVVLMDLLMPVMDGVETTRQLMNQFPQLKIIVLTSFLDDEKVLQAIEAGAANYVLKTVSSQELVTSIHGACQAHPTMSMEISQALTRGLRQRSSQNDDEEFTVREKEVLLLIANGKANKDIAEELHISIKTVKTHVSNLLMKCGMEDRTQLAIYAHRKGWAG